VDAPVGSGRLERSVYGAWIITLGGLALYAYGTIIAKAWFLYDDPELIWTVASFPLRELFFSPETVRATTASYTPMIAVSLKLDWLLFRLDPLGYALHSTGAALCAAWLFYLFLRLFIPRRPALAGTMLFLVHPATVTVSAWFSTRHYVEGMIWALAALTTHIRALRRGTSSPAAPLLFGLAALSKEVYVVLPAVAFLLTPGSGRVRLRSTLPWWIVLAGYGAVRLWILGGTGGYPSGSGLFSVETVVGLGRLAEAFARQWFGPAFFVMCALAALLAAYGRSRPGILAIAPILVLPIIPLGTQDLSAPYTGRYFFHLAGFTVAAIAVVLHRTLNKRGTARGMIAGGITAVAVLAALQTVALTGRLGPERAAARASSEAFRAGTQSFLKPVQPSWYYEGLRKISRDFLGKRIDTRLVPPRRYLKYATPEVLTELQTAGVDLPYGEISAENRSLEAGPMDVRITIDGSRITWELAAEGPGRFFLIGGPARGLYYHGLPCAPRGTYDLGAIDRISDGNFYIRVVHRRADGTEAVSPEFAFTIPGRETFEYKNEGSGPDVPWP